MTRSDARRGATAWVPGRRGLAGPALAAMLALACSTTPPPTGLHVVQEERPPPLPEEVTRVQRALAALGLYLGPLDGRLGAETRVALARFQRRAGLDATGELDPGTLQALLEKVPEAEGEPPPAEAAPERPELPPAEALLEEERPVPQPPPGWLDPVLAEARALLAEGEAAVRAILAAEGGTAAEMARRLGEAEQRVQAARVAAFDLVVAARVRGGFAPLPEALLRTLRQALAERRLLVRPGDGAWGGDEEEAVRWLERSLGLSPTGLPSLQLLEAVGIDPSEVFEGGGLDPRRNSR